MSTINRQKETNLHNIFWIEQPIGGVYRAVSIMILMTGVVIPVLTLAGRGRRLIQRYAYRSCPGAGSRCSSVVSSTTATIWTC